MTSESSKSKAEWQNTVPTTVSSRSSAT